MDLSYLYSLGYTEEKITNYSKYWAPEIIEYLAENSDYVAENMRYLQDDFEEDLLLKLPVFYPETFVLKPELFQERIRMLKDAFSYEWIDIIENQFWGYDGIPGTNYKPIMRTLASYDDADIQDAIKQLKNPYDITFEFMVLLSKDAGLEISAANFFEEDLWWIESSKYEVLRNAKLLLEKGLTKELVEDIICSAPYLMMLSEMEVKSRLRDGFGEEYITTMQDLDSKSFFEKLEEIGY